MPYASDNALRNCPDKSLGQKWLQRGTFLQDTDKDHDLSDLSFIIYQSVKLSSVSYQHFSPFFLKCLGVLDDFRPLELDLKGTQTTSSFILRIRA